MDDETLARSAAKRPGHWHLQRCWAFPTGVGKFTRTPKRCRNLWEIYGKYMGDAWEMGNSLEIRISPSGIYGNGWLNGIWRAINDCKWGSTGNIIRIQLEVGWNHSNPQKDAAKVGDPGKFRIFPDPFGGCYSRNEDFIHQNEDLINRNDLVGGLEHLDYLSIYWEKQPQLTNSYFSEV